MPEVKSVEKMCAVMDRGMAEIDKLRTKVTSLQFSNDALLEKGLELAAHKVALREALDGLIYVINAAGLSNLANGVQLGNTVWFVKANDAMERAQAAMSETDPMRDEPLSPKQKGAER